jgi:hypothetical protein
MIAMKNNILAKLSRQENTGYELVSDGDTSVKEGGCYEDYIGGEEVGAGENDHYEADREHKRASSAY